ncbi:CBU_0592 family membrane protein [Neptunicoccus cionae]|uniref:CBU-0592-like domain-containing protein n=1 Tax=Neptunicoccus cionae TaxID=2035344 RepID=A0A916VRE0_9RHOB|nr:hypothetical protein [Amylibacter cionae]GGA22022.1 hypothetical protein GCM10011498_23440 [Amylibacter cionae]
MPLGTVMSEDFILPEFFRSMSAVSLICNGIGVAGFMLYMTNYTLVTFQRIDSRGVLFFSLNTLAATLVLISLSQNFNLASAMIQIVWIFLGSIAIRKRLARRGGSQGRRLKRTSPESNFPVAVPESGAI